MGEVLHIGRGEITVAKGPTEELGTPCFAADDFESYEIMQFTGLYDKNGKEIWEGDIVRETHRHWDDANHELHSPLGIVRYLAPEFYGFYDERLDNPICNTIGGVRLGGECEVLGNIYENAELLDFSEKSV